MSTSKAFVVVAALVASAGIAVPAAQAATPTVRYVSPTGTDTGTCSSKQAPCQTIGYAVTQTAGGDTVKVAAGHYAEAVVVTTSLSIVGAGAGKTVVSGDGKNPGFSLGNGKKTTTDRLSGLSVTGTKSEGILAEGVRLTLTGVVADHNEVGAFVFDGSLTATRSSFSHNTASSKNGELDGIGVFATGATVSLSRSEADDNNFVGVIAEPEFSSAASDAAVQHSRVTGARAFLERESAAQPRAKKPSTLSVRDSSISGNRGPGFAVFQLKSALTDDTLAYNEGAAVYVENASATLTQLTVTHTEKYTGKAKLGASGAIVSVKAASGNKVAPAPKQVTIAGSIDAKNTVHDCNTHVIDNGYNLSSDKSNACKFGKAGHDLIKTNPKLGRLGQHGGFARTALPSRTSRAVNAVPLKHAGCVKGHTDQRGVRRPQPTSGHCDIGSVELTKKG